MPALEAAIYQIVHPWDRFDRSAARKINKFFREQDDSHLWPIRGRFNATERAIRRVRKAAAGGLELDYNWQYIENLEQEMSSIVNDSRNW